MGISPEPLTKLKDDFEASIKHLPAPQKTAAMVAWNRAIDAAISIATVNLLKMKQFKVLDQVNLASVTKIASQAGAVYKIAAGAASKMKGFMSRSKSPQATNVAKSFTGLSGTASAADRIAANTKARAEANVQRGIKAVQDLSDTIDVLGTIKFDV